MKCQIDSLKKKWRILTWQHAKGLMWFYLLKQSSWRSRSYPALVAGLASTEPAGGEGPPPKKNYPIEIYACTWAAAHALDLWTQQNILSMNTNDSGKYIWSIRQMGGAREAGKAHIFHLHFLFLSDWDREEESVREKETSDWGWGLGAVLMLETKNHWAVSLRNSLELFFAFPWIVGREGRKQWWKRSRSLLGPGIFEQFVRASVEEMWRQKASQNQTKCGGDEEPDQFKLNERKNGDKTSHNMLLIYVTEIHIYIKQCL